MAFDKCAACGIQGPQVRVRAPVAVLKTPLCDICLAEGVLWACQERALIRQREEKEAKEREEKAVAEGGR